MKNLEEHLAETKAPEPRVTTFRRDLRGALLDRIALRPRAGAAYRVALAGSLAMTLVLAGIVALLVLRPGYARSLHDLVHGEDVLPFGALGDDGYLADPGPFLDGDPSFDPGPGLGDPALDGDYAIPAEYALARAALDVDRDFVRSWARDAFPAETVSVQPVAPPQTFTFNRFRLHDGRIVQVVTRLPDKVGIEAERLFRMVEGEGFAPLFPTGPVPENDRDPGDDPDPRQEYF